MLETLVIRQEQRGPVPHPMTEQDPAQPRLLTAVQSKLTQWRARLHDGSPPDRTSRAHVPRLASNLVLPAPLRQSRPTCIGRDLGPRGLGCPETVRARVSHLLLLGQVAGRPGCGGG